MKRRFKEMSATGIREAFWRLPEVRQAMKTVQYQRSSGIPSELLFDQQPLEQNVRMQSLFHLEPKAVHDDKGDQGADLPPVPRSGVRLLQRGSREPRRGAVLGTLLPLLHC